MTIRSREVTLKKLTFILNHTDVGMEVRTEKYSNPGNICSEKDNLKIKSILYLKMKAAK